MLNLHHQAVAKLRKLLMDEDKQFQATQQQERAYHDAAMVSSHCLLGLMQNS